MKTLLVCTSFAQSMLAFFDENALQEVKYSLENVPASKQLLPDLDALLKRQGIGPKDIELLVCTTGPGSFTGIRVGASIMQTFCFTFETPLIGIESLKAFYPDKGKFMCVCDAKTPGIYAIEGEVSENQEIKWGKLGLIGEKDLINRQSDFDYYCFDYPSLKRKFQRLNLEIPTGLKEVKQDPSKVYSLALQAYAQGSFSQNGALFLSYVQDAQAKKMINQK